jgi:hypothetical protein
MKAIILLSFRAFGLAFMATNDGVITSEAEISSRALIQISQFAKV